MNGREAWYRDWRLARNILLFSLGAIGLITLTTVWVITSRTPEPSLMIAFTAMMGLPVFLSADERAEDKAKK